MILRKYLMSRGIKMVFFSNQLGISRNSLWKYMKRMSPVPKHIKLAVQQLTENKVHQVEDEIKKNNMKIK